MGTFPNNPRQCAHPKTQIFRIVLERLSSRLKSLSERLGPFRTNFASFRRRRDAVFAVIVDQLIKKKSKKVFRKRLKTKIEQKMIL